MSLDVSLVKVMPTEIYSDNITHNLNKMAQEAGLYDALWRPDENGLTTAADLIPFLEEGLRKLCADPAHYEQFNPANGWGSYVGLKVFVRDYLEACRANPDAKVEVSR
jgi:hypothetical protein